jgi:hypothetical protein
MVTTLGEPIEHHHARLAYERGCRAVPPLHRMYYSRDGQILFVEVRFPAPLMTPATEESQCPIQALRLKRTQSRNVGTTQPAITRKT